MDKTKDLVALCTAGARGGARREGRPLLVRLQPVEADLSQGARRSRRSSTRTRANWPIEARSLSRVNRLYLPTTAQLAGADTAQRATYPSTIASSAAPRGTVCSRSPCSPVASLTNTSRRARDGGYLQVDGRPRRHLHREPRLRDEDRAEEDLSVVYAEDKSTTGSFEDFIQWTVYGRGWPEGMPASNRDNIARTIANKLDNHWFTFEAGQRRHRGPGAEARDHPHRDALRRGRNTRPSPRTPPG